MLKKIIIALILIAAAAGAVIYFYRYAIIRYYAEKMIRENLPGYIKIDNINFDFGNNKFSLVNFRVANPPGFHSESLLKIDEISCRYSMFGKGVSKGLEISDVSLSGIDMRIERLKSGRVNAAEMEKFVQSFPSRDSRLPSAERSGASPKGTPDSQVRSEAEPPRRGLSNAPSASQTFKEAAGLVNKKLSDLIKLPSSFEIRNSKIIFMDYVPYENPYVMAVDSVSGQIAIDFSDNYSKITNLSFTLVGRLNGYAQELLQWVGSLNPATPKITMSNRFDVSNLNLLAFEPYYDRFSPFVFKRGRFSGTLVFDFNNGDVGSTNEVHLSKLAFSVKPGYENAQVWETNVPALMSYFTTASGDIVFDFKLKGDMADPQFYLGPISKRALTSMAIDKVASYAIDQVTKQSEGAGKNIDKAKEAIDMVRSLLKKK